MFVCRSITFIFSLVVICFHESACYSKWNGSGSVTEEIAFTVTLAETENATLHWSNWSPLMACTNGISHTFSCIQKLRTITTHFLHTCTCMKVNQECSGWRHAWSVLIFPLKRSEWSNESALQRKEADWCLPQFFIPAITTTTTTTTTTRDWLSWGCHAYFAIITNTKWRTEISLFGGQLQENWNPPSGETLGMQNKKKKKKTWKMLAVLVEPEVNLRFKKMLNDLWLLWSIAIDKMTLKSLFSEL